MSGSNSFIGGCIAAATLLVASSAPFSVCAEREEPAGCFCIDRVGNVNCDYADLVSLADVALLIDHLFISGVRLPSLEEANVDADPYGIINMADLVLLIDHLFINRPQLPLCPTPYNTPPNTRIVNAASTMPFINAAEDNLLTAGVFLAWTGQDLVDHPYYPPEFEFEYRLYGPYTDSVYRMIRDSFQVTVFLTNTGALLRKGLPPDTVGCDTIFDGDRIDTIICRTLRTHYIVCDTTWDGGIREITCDTVLIDTLKTGTNYGRLDTLLDILVPSFQTNPTFNRLVALSDAGPGFWTRRTRDTMYNVFQGHPSDTTRQMKFIFWVRARDPLDSLLYDLTPAFRVLEVIDPCFERDILILNWTPQAAENRSLSNRLLPFWNQMIADWIQSRGLSDSVDFNIDRDLIFAGNLSQGYELLRLALRYKILIAIQDAATSGGWSVAGSQRGQVLTAIGSGVNSWVAARIPLGNHILGTSAAVDLAPDDYAYFFGTLQSTYSGWGRGLFDTTDGDGYGLPRTEDFVGAYSENSSLWPDIAIDTALLHSRYDWQGGIDPPIFPYYPFLPSIGALPEVGWTQPAADAEVMYRYRSLYGAQHPILNQPTYEGRPVMHRLDRGRFRTVHANFTPSSLATDNARQMISAVLDWLYFFPTEQLGRRLEGVASTESTCDYIRQWYLDLRDDYTDADTANHGAEVSTGEGP